MTTTSVQYNRSTFRRAVRALRVPAAAFLLLLLSAFSAIQGASREKPSLNVSISPNRIWPGESAVFRVQVRNLAKSVTPDLSYLEGEFDVEYLGSDPLSRSMTITINGKTTVTEERGETFVYRLTPKRGGTIQIEPPIVESDGVPLSAAPAILRVMEPDDANLPPEERRARLDVSVSPDEIYPLSPFTITLSVYLREDSTAKNSGDPLLKSGNRNPPELLFDWGLDETIPAGLEPDEELSQWLESYISSRGGFSINRLRQNNPFSLFGGEPSLLTFLPKSELVRVGKSEDAPRYRRYDFTRTFTAGEPGSYNMPPARLKGVLGGREIYAASEPVTVTVREIPQPRPEGYIGVVSRGSGARLAARLSSDRGRVGEAITLELTLTGAEGAVDLQTPDLTEIDRLKNRFKIYAPNEERSGGAIRWRWNLRPLTPDGDDFPAIDLTCFDAAAGEFKKLRTDELPLSIEAGNADLESFAQDEPAVETDGPASTVGTPTPLTQIPATFSLGGMALAAGVLYAAAGVLALAGWTRRRRRANRDRTARQTGERLLRRAFAEGAGAVHRAVVSAFLSPFAAEENRRADALSRSEIDALLAARKADASGSEFPKLADEFGVLLDRLEAEKFAGADTGVTESEVTALYRRWTAALKERTSSRVKKSGTKTLGLVLLPILLALTGCKPDLETREEFDRAVALHAQAEASGDPDEKARLFRQSAAVYEGLLVRGKESGAIFYNLGCAYRRSGDNPRALAAWRRAESYIPGDKELEAAIADVKPNEAAEKRGFLDALFFWHRLISRPAQEKLFLGLTLAAALLAASTVFAPNPRRRALRRIAAAAFLISLAVFGATALDRYCQARRIVVIAETDLREGNGDAYERIARLRPLDECRLLETRRDWLRVKAPDGAEGWIETENALTR